MRSLKVTAWVAILAGSMYGCQTISRNVESAMNWMNGKVSTLQMKQDKDGLPPKQEVQRVLSGNQELAIVPDLLCSAKEPALPPNAEAPYPVASAATLIRRPDVDGLPAGNSFGVAITNPQKVASVQANAQWCWAACVEMALKAQRVSIVPSDQKGIAEKYRAESVDQSGNYALILRALRPDMQTALQGKIFVPLIIVPPSSDMIVHRLSRGEVVIAGIGADPDVPDGGGHAVAIIGCTFAVRDRSGWRQFTDAVNVGQQPDHMKDTETRIALHSVTYFDPWPGAGIQTISAESLNERILFLGSYGYAGDVIQRFLKNGR